MTQASAIASKPTLSRDTQETTIATASARSVMCPRVIEPSSRAHASAGAPRTPCLEGDRKQRDENHRDDREPEVLLDDRRVAEEVAEQAEAPDPQNASRDVEREEARIAHAADAGDERRERAHDRHEPREHDGLSA